MSSTVDYPTQHKAAVVTKQKGQNEIQTRPTPSLKPDEVLIRITATAINPIDWKMRDWGIFVPTYPVILGSDAAGVIAGVGASVDRFKQGDRVFFQGILGADDEATFQEYCKMPAELVGHSPDNLSDDEVAGVALAVACVITALYSADGFGISPTPWDRSNERSPPGKGKSIVILGGSSSVGQYAIQLARLSGFETIVTGSSAQHFEMLKRLGATHVLNRSSATNEEYARAAFANGHSFDMLYDCISTKDTHLQGVEILHSAGTYANDSRHRRLVGVYTFDTEVEWAAKRAGNVNLNVIWGKGSSAHIRPLIHGFVQAAGGPHGWLATRALIVNRPLVVQGGLRAVDEGLNKNRDGISGQKIVIHPSSP